MGIPRGVQVLPAAHGHRYMAGDRFTFNLGALRLAIPHPDRPGQVILFGPEDVTVLFHPEFLPEAPPDSPAQDVPPRHPTG